MVKSNKWSTKKLGEVCEFVRSGITPFDGEKEYIDTNSVQDFSIVKFQKITYEERPSRANMEAKTNDVLVAKMKDTLKVYLATLKDEKERVFSTGFFVSRPKRNLIEPKYLFLYYSSNLFQNLKDELARGSTQKAINDEKLKKYFEIPLPPLKIQKQIVARIEELFEKIDKAKELRQKAKEETETIFPSALKKAFSVLKVKKEPLNQLCETIYRYPSFYGIKWKKEGIPVLRGENIRDNNLLDEDTRHYNYVDKSINDKFPKTILKEEDLVMCVRGSIGKIAIVGNNFAGANISPNLIRIAPIHKRINSRYLLHFLSSFVTKEFFLEHTKAATISTIKASDLKNLQISLPPLCEQKKIVAYLDNLREKVSKLKQIQEEQLRDLVELKKSILDRAFSGKSINEKK